jgi:hypothetical protein
MAYGGTQTVTHPRPRVVKIVADTIDADADITAAVDLRTLFTAQCMPNRAVLHVDRTAGSTDVIDVALQISAFNDSDWQDLITATSSAGTLDYWPTADYGEPATAEQNKLFQYVRINCTTVGVANTLTATVLLESPG